jgi:hypothetical protein
VCNVSVTVCVALYDAFSSAWSFYLCDLSYYFSATATRKNSFTDQTITIIINSAYAIGIQNFFKGLRIWTHRG